MSCPYIDYDAVCSGKGKDSDSLSRELSESSDHYSSGSEPIISYRIDKAPKSARLGVKQPRKTAEADSGCRGER